MTSNRGMSMLEVLIGFFIIAGASVIFFQTIYKFRAETTFYSENYIASALQERVLELCYQETELNPYGIQTLGLADGSGNPYPIENYITEGNSIFFNQPPITSQSHHVLHHMLNDNFKLELVANNADGYYDLQAQFNWTAATGRGNSTAFGRVLSISGEKEVTTELAIIDDFVRERIRREIFMDPSTPISSKVGSADARDLIMNTGHILYAGRDYLSSSAFQSKYARAEQLESLYSPTRQEYENCNQIYLEIARDILHLMVALKDRIEAVEKEFSQNNKIFLNAIGSPEKERVLSYIRESGRVYKTLRNVFLISILKLADRHEKMLSDMSSRRLLRTVLKRTFNLYRILYVNRDFLDDSLPSPVIPSVDIRYTNFLTSMKNHFEERDPSINRMAVQELAFISDGSITTRFFLPGMINKLFLNLESLIEAE